MKFISSSKGKWGFFDPSGNFNNDPNFPWSEQWFAKGHSYLYQLPGIIISILIIISLFIFKKFYLKTVSWKLFRIFIGVYQLFTYFLYYILMIFYLKFVLKTNWLNHNGPSKVRGLSELVPLHLSSIHQLLSGLILIFPNRKLFELVAPSGLIIPFISIITPVNGYWTFDNWFYYNYFILHALIIFSYLYVYRYGLINERYSGLLFKYSIIWLLLMSFVAVIWNYIFSTNLLFVGPPSKLNEPWNSGGFIIFNWNTNTINNINYWPFSWLPMFLLGIILMILTHIILFYIYRVFYFDNNKNKFLLINKEQNKLFYNYYGFIYILLSFKFIFISKNNVFINIKKYNLFKYYFPFY